MVLKSVQAFKDVVQTTINATLLALLLAIFYGGYWAYSKINAFVASPPKIDGGAMVKSIKGMMPEIDTKAVMKEIGDNLPKIDTKAVMKEIVGKIEVPSAGEVMKEVIGKVELPNISIPVVDRAIEEEGKKVVRAMFKTEPGALEAMRQARLDKLWKEEILAGRGRNREYMSQQNVMDHNEIAFWSNECEKHKPGTKEFREASDKMFEAMGRYTDKWIDFKK